MSLSCWRVQMSPNKNMIANVWDTRCLESQRDVPNVLVLSYWGQDSTAHQCGHISSFVCPCCRVDSIMLVEEGFDVVSVDASDKMLKYALKSRWERRKEPAFDQWGMVLLSHVFGCSHASAGMWFCRRASFPQTAATNARCAQPVSSCLFFWANAISDLKAKKRVHVGTFSLDGTLDATRQIYGQISGGLRARASARCVPTCPASSLCCLISGCYLLSDWRG